MSSLPIPAADRDRRTLVQRFPLPTLPEASASLLRTIVVALFLLTFVLQPFLIPSESMERTLLVGDFLLVNKQIFAPVGKPGSLLMPYRNIQRRDVVVFHFPQDPKKFLVKRVIGVPGDRLSIHDGQVMVNDVAMNEPYVVREPAAFNTLTDNFPARVYNDPAVDPVWWAKLQTLIRNGEMTVPPGQYFMMGDNRNHSYDSRSWGFVPRDAIVARPLVIYFSLRRPSRTDLPPFANDKLGHEREFPAGLAGFARWDRMFRVIR